MRLFGAVLLVLVGCGDDGAGVETMCGVSKLVADGFGGPYELGGTVTFPEPLSSSKLVQIVVSFAPTAQITRGNIFDYTTVGSGASSVTYAVTGLDADDYYVYVAVDLTGDMKVGEGDWVGFYGGTVAAPSQYANQQLITISTENACGRDWGINTLACKASYGEACTTDDDCRGTVTVCDGGSETHRNTGSCQGTCMELPVGTCGAQAGTTTHEGSCVGD